MALAISWFAKLGAWGIILALISPAWADDQIQQDAFKLMQIGRELAAIDLERAYVAKNKEAPDDPVSQNFHQYLTFAGQYREAIEGGFHCNWLIKAMSMIRRNHRCGCFCPRVSMRSARNFMAAGLPNWA